MAVFGFDRDKASDVIHRFQKYGEIVRCVRGSGNWLHIQYKQEVRFKMHD
jgi:Nup53/35/40-type RNA recognition motif